MNGQAVIYYNGHTETKLSEYNNYRTDYHIIWIPKYGRPILNPELLGYWGNFSEDIYESTRL